MSSQGFLQKMSSAALKLQTESNAGRSEEKARAYGDLNAKGGLQEYNLDLSTLSASQQSIVNLSGYGIVAAALGSSGGAFVKCFFNGGSDEKLLAPGMGFKQPFRQIGFQLDSAGPVSGILRLVILKDASSEYWEMPSAGEGSVQAVTNSMPGGALQAYNGTKVTTNIPTALTADERKRFCIDASKAKFIRFMLSCVANPNILGGTILLWVFDQNAGFWYASGVEIPLQTGTGRVATGDYEIGVQSGLVWGEAYGVTNAAAGGDITLLARAS